jgi:serine acetyltransferase
VIGAGSVVTKDIPADVFAAGNPCGVIRVLTGEEKQFLASAKIPKQVKERGHSSRQNIAILFSQNDQHR